VKTAAKKVEFKLLDNRGSAVGGNLQAMSTMLSKALSRSRVSGFYLDGFGALFLCRASPLWISFNTGGGGHDPVKEIGAAVSAGDSADHGDGAAFSFVNLYGCLFRGSSSDSAGLRSVLGKAEESFLEVVGGYGRASWGDEHGELIGLLVDFGDVPWLGRRGVLMILKRADVVAFHRKAIARDILRNRIARIYF